MSSVAQISFMDNGDELLCSGSLVATRDNSFKPYFLTAGHCINNEAAARTVEAYWTYQTPACGGTPPASRTTSVKSTVGAHLIASAPMAAGDFSLVLLQDAPAGTTFAGWDIVDPPMATGLTGIHHPSGSWKRISFGERTSDATNNVQGVDAPGNLFLQVKWDSGRVEHGSSGSPLFSAPGVIVGSLSYGEFLEDGTVCTINPSVSGYSRFSVTYAQVRDYLENLPADLVTPAKPEIGFAIANRAAPAAQSVQLLTQSTGQVIYKARADASWIKLSGITGSLSAKTPATLERLGGPGAAGAAGPVCGHGHDLLRRGAAAVPAGDGDGTGGSIECDGQHHTESGGAERCGVELPDSPGGYGGRGHAGYGVEVQRGGLHEQYRGLVRHEPDRGERLDCGDAARLGRVSAWRSVL